MPVGLAPAYKLERPRTFAWPLLTDCGADVQLKSGLFDATVTLAPLALLVIVTAAPLAAAVPPVAPELALTRAGRLVAELFALLPTLKFVPDDALLTAVNTTPLIVIVEPTTAVDVNVPEFVVLVVPVELLPAELSP